MDGKVCRPWIHPSSRNWASVGGTRSPNIGVGRFAVQSCTIRKPNERLFR